MTGRARSGFLGRLAGDRRGVSAVEFALIAPLMIGFYLAMAEFCQAYIAQKRMGHGAAMVADLVSQTDVVTAAEVQDIFGVGDLVMKPFSSSSLQQRVSSVARDEQGVAKVVWSQGDGMTALAKGATVTVPAGLIANGESVIMSEATYDYDSPLDYVMDPVTQFSQSFYLRPRRVELVGCADC